MKNNKYYYYEFKDFSINKENVLNLIVTNYMRKIKLNQDYAILVLTNSNSEFDFFVKYVNDILNNITIKTINDYLPSYLQYNFKQKDLENRKKLKIIQMTKKDYNNYNNEYDFVILKPITKRYLEKIVYDKTYHEKSNSNNYLYQNNIYLKYYKNTFDKIYRKALGNFHTINNKPEYR